MRNCSREGADERPWFVLQVLTNQEKKVARHLALRAIEHYLPLYCERSRWSDRVANLERPLFAGYVFTRLAPQTRLTVISTPGVLRLLGDDERHAVPAQEMDRIRQSLASGGQLRPYGGSVVGSRVRVVEGPFQGIEGIVTDLRQSCKVILLLSATRQCFSLEIDVANIEVLEGSDAAQGGDTIRQLALNGV
jgi:transcription antitermination factor NusG